MSNEPLMVTSEVDETTYEFTTEQDLELWSLHDLPTFVRSRPATEEELVAARRAQPS